METNERFASKKAFLFLFSLANIIQGMYSTYFVSTLTTIERLYEIQSKTVGAIMSATEFGTILGSLLVSYYGGKGNKPKWITVCMTMSALAAIMSTSPHFLLYDNSSNKQHNILNSFNLNIAEQQHYSFELIGKGQLCSSVITAHQLKEPQNLNVNSVVVVATGNNNDINTEDNLFAHHHNATNTNDSIGWFHQDHLQSKATITRTTTTTTLSSNGNNKMKQPTEIIFVIFFLSLLVIGFGSTAMTTLGIPFIDDIVSREESPLYLGVTIGLRIFGPALGFLLGSVCIQLNVNFPFDTTTHNEASQASSINWIGAWWLGLILISLPLLLLALPMYYFSLITKKEKSTPNKTSHDENYNLNCDDRVSGIKLSNNRGRHDYKKKGYYDNIDKDNNSHQDDDDDLENDLNDEIIVSSVPTTQNPSQIINLTKDSLSCLHHRASHNQHYFEYRLNNAYEDYEKSSHDDNETNQSDRQIHSNLRSIDISDLLTINMTKLNKTQQTISREAHKKNNCCDDADSVITRSSLDLSLTPSIESETVENNAHRNHNQQKRRRYLSSTSTPSMSDHQHDNNYNQDHLEDHRQKNISEHIHRQKVKSTWQQQTCQKPQKQNNKINSLTNSIRRLMKNKVFMLRLVSTVLHILPIAGFFTFLPKYLIEQFKVNASSASAISGLAGILFVGLGAFIGGSLIRIFKINSKCVTRWIASSALAYAIGLLILMQLGCPQENLVTYDMTISNSNYDNHKYVSTPHLSCTNSCNCRQSVYNPICVQRTTYLSPCLAGCSNYTQLDDQSVVYYDCKCHVANSDNRFILDYSIDDLLVTNGPCKSNCDNLKWYILVFSLFVLIHATCEVGSMMLNLRCVDSKDRALALGMVTFASSLMGTIPCSIIYGSVIDLTCIHWDTFETDSSLDVVQAKVEPSRGACRIYDNDKFRLYLHGLTAIVMIFAFIVDSIICRKAGKINYFLEKSTDRQQVDRTHSPETIKTTLKRSSSEQLNNMILDNFTADGEDEEDDGVVGHSSENEEYDNELAQTSHRQVA